MKNKLKLSGTFVLFILIVSLVSSCSVLIDDHVYWPDSLVYISNSAGNIKHGFWNTNPLADLNDTGNYLLFENNTLTRHAVLKIKDEADEAGVTENYNLVSYGAHSFTVQNGSNEYTVTFEIIGNVLTILNTGGIKNKNGDVLEHLIYFRINE